MRAEGGRLKNSAQKEQVSNFARAAENQRKTGDAQRLSPLQKKYLVKRGMTRWRQEGELEIDQQDADW